MPSLHEKLYGDDDSQLIPFRDQFVNYHRNRVARIDNDFDERPVGSADKRREFIGVDGVNFLTAF